ncbi:putative sugar transferase EpsL [Robertmurraya siralis]|uniref:Sugar transferase EpsL n=1 Tax=Robertmurraya siralis TaxID=77777 RepID=A0A920BTM4_9BACI|nr:sugar transferase [Robertmurraya siralis]PAE20016.1 sugar transferase [Bacillus sp. 7504-2]GIN62014.1 putative sugar transferase EpsL [Robertmurraya siralis]
MKRIVDLSIALPLVIVAAPLMLVISLIIRWKLGTPILFKQQRPGLNGKPFQLYKFRSMTNENDQNGQLLPDQQRITPFGMFLRKYSLDELPQLFNVIKGEVSLVGPRPLLMEYLPLYSERQAKRHLVKPGITGWAQVNGRNAITWEEKFELDVWYVENRSFFLDMRILLLTLLKVISTENVSLDEIDFEGSADKEISTKSM